MRTFLFLLCNKYPIQIKYSSMKKKDITEIFLSFISDRTMLHLPSMITYGLLSFSMAFLNKALFEIADFRYSLFVIFIQLLFVIFSFEILARVKLVTKPSLTSNDAYVFLIPSVFYSLSTILSLQALMQLNVAIYVVIKVGDEEFGREREENKSVLSLALYTSLDLSFICACFKETKAEFSSGSVCFCHHVWRCDNLHRRSHLSCPILLHWQS